MRARIYLAINALARRVAVWSAKGALRTARAEEADREVVWS